MVHRCLFCQTPFPENGTFPHFPRGRRIAFDPEKGRLWAVCGKCFRWTLAPIEHRDAALYELAKAAHDRGVPVARTDNVALLHVGRTLLIRVGKAGLTEQAWWRYGKELRKRKASFDSRAARVTAATFGAFQYVGEVLGLADPDVPIDWDDKPMTDILRWRRFGWAAWHGREVCSYCHSNLRALRYDTSWWVYPLMGDNGEVGVGVPCPRCDPWTPDNVYHLKGIKAENALRRILAYQNITGASERLIRDAAGQIEASGSTGAFAIDAVDRRQCLWKMGPTATVALEIAVSESAEQRMLDMELGAVEYIWRQEEELARIMDEELTPRHLIEAHLRKLPIRVGKRQVPKILRDSVG